MDDIFFFFVKGSAFAGSQNRNEWMVELNKNKIAILVRSTVFCFCYFLKTQN